MKLNISPLLIIIGIGFITLVTSVPSQQKLIVKDGDPSTGYWETKTQWKTYWVKNWIPKMIYVPIWKKIWSPVSIKQWVPLPRPPPGLKPQLPIQR
ncbi:protein of unknown function (DUF4816) [Popillia japonica]|uniref:ATP synthase F0 subunit 8 n=1 Tax=Popillia japonica TaxID=7064 RepID=A0AAW1JYS9_POPJA